MRRRILWMLVALPLLYAVPASAQQAEAKATALAANCKPTKLEVLKQVNGRMAETVYKVNCGGQQNKDAFVVVQCRDRTCALAR